MGARKSVAEKVAQLKRKEAWRITRKAEKLEAEAAVLRREAEKLLSDAAMEGVAS